MLQFLQYKIFGRHRVPEGQIVVAAGNPPEYNNSVREFDIVTWDRLKRIDCEPVYDIWKEYAYKTGVHAAITTYLDIKKGDFYRVETTVDGKSFVTARGWTDLSDMIKLYEKNNIKVDEKLVAQYLQNKKIAKKFSIYYDLWNKYKSDYQVDKILDGKADEGTKIRAKNAKFDERLSLLGLIIDGIIAELKAVCNKEEIIKELLDCLKTVKIALTRLNEDAVGEIEKQISIKDEAVAAGIRAGTLSKEKCFILKRTISTLESIKETLLKENPDNGNQAFVLVKAEFDKLTKQ